MPVSRPFIGIFQDEWRIQGITDELDIQRRVVTIALNRLEFQKSEGNLIMDDIEVGAILRNSELSHQLREAAEVATADATAAAVRSTVGLKSSSIESNSRLP